MITEFLVGWFSDMLVVLLGFLPDVSPEVEDGLSSATLQLSTVVESVAPFEVVVPFSTFFQAAVVGIGAMLVQVAVRVVRIALSFVTLGGGM